MNVTMNLPSKNIDDADDENNNENDAKNSENKLYNGCKIPISTLAQ